MKKNSLLGELEEQLTELVLVSKELVELSLMSVDEKLITDLQKKEEKLIKKVSQLDLQISKQYPKQDVAELFPKQWKVIKKLLKGFQNLNEEFIGNLSAKKGLVGTEIIDLIDQHSELDKIKKNYDEKRIPETKNSGPINPPI